MYTIDSVLRILEGDIKLLIILYFQVQKYEYLMMITLKYIHLIEKICNYESLTKSKRMTIKTIIIKTE